MLRNTPSERPGLARVGRDEGWSRAYTIHRVLLSALNGDPKALKMCRNMGA